VCSCDCVCLVIYTYTTTDVMDLEEEEVLMLALLHKKISKINVTSTGFILCWFQDWKRINPK